MEYIPQGLKEFDNLYVFCPSQPLLFQKLNNWNVLRAGGFEVESEKY